MCYRTCRDCDNWRKREFYKKMYGGDSLQNWKNSAQVHNFLIQSNAAALIVKEELSLMEKIKDKSCKHGLKFAGLFCSKCVREGRVPFKDAVPNINFEVDNRVFLDIIYKHIDKLTKDQLQELYEKLYSSYNCRIPK